MAQVSKAAGVAELGVERPVQPDWQPKLASLIAARGGSMSPIEFQRLVNVVFHDVEAGVYDRVHDEMWKSLRPIVGRLADDALTSGPVGTGLVLADIGCGTGLATTLLLETALGSRVERLELVDTSSEMLARCRRRQSVWRRPAVFRTGGIEALNDSSVDAVVASSLLHHVPDVTSFCAHVDRVLRPGGVFLHLQDPRSGSGDDRPLVERRRELAETRGRTSFRAGWPRVLRLPFSAWNRALQWRKSAYLREVNRRLIQARAIRYPMTNSEIWSVTDIHVEGLPYAVGDGISRADLQVGLHAFANISWRTYSFYGEMASKLPADYAERERDFFERDDPSGASVAGVWAKPW
jgi:ubiquinone/menaquinone biosynthesis C-methylase UbiE